MTDVEGVVQSNLDAYNQRDIDQFMAVVSDEISLFTFGESHPSLVGKEAIRDFYAALFENSPDLHSIILSRLVIGNKVIDHESITGRNGSSDVVELVLIYEVEQDAIVRITVMRP